ncbi:CotH kinase family protein, partial [candidate division KSB1 bacterium]|nr:CotH kinase family protein [candidate division KSB1 bacterium]
MLNLKSVCVVFIQFLALGLAATQGLAQATRLYLNEFMASNVLAFAGADGEYADWIEIYNPGNAPIDLAGYYLTDDLAANQYWQIPTGASSQTTIAGPGYLVLYADARPEAGATHLNFKLSRDAGQIGLLAPDRITLLDSVTYRHQVRDVSLGRAPNGGSAWVYFENFTPGAANQHGFPSVATAPVIAQQSGFYGHSVLVSVQPAQAGDTLRYESDGSDPGRNSPQYFAPVQLDRTSVFKVRAFHPRALPSPSITRPFFIDTQHTLPVLILMTDPQNLYDPATGIYVNDFDGRGWERFAELEFFNNQVSEFYMPAGIRLQGNSGPAEYQKKSFRVYFRNGYGAERLNYALYPENPVTSFARLVLRSGYDDSLEPTTAGKNSLATLIRDPLLTKLWQQCGGLTPQSRLTVLYLNNQFHGIYDLKESIDEYFIRDHLGFADLDLMRTRWDTLELVYGERQPWQELVHFFQQHSFTSNEEIAAAGRILDLDNFINLQALIHGAEYIGWAYGVFMFRQKTASAQWQWTIWDADRAYIDLKWNGFTSPYNPIAAYLDTLITKKLLRNQAFKTRYINRLADLLNTVFLPERVKAVIDSLAQNIAPEIPAEVNKWNNTVAKWHTNIDFLKSFAEQRPAIVRQQMQDYFNLPGQAELTLSVEAGQGGLKINTLTLRQFPWSGKYFQAIPVTITAIPEPGYRFAGWSDPTLPARESITLILAGHKSLAAMFTKLGAVNAELIAPSRIKSGQRLPFVVRIRDANWQIDPIEQTPIQVKFFPAHSDTTIQIKRGAGTGIVQITADTAFNLLVQNESVSPIQKRIGISSVPTLTCAGTLNSGEIIWDATVDRFITADLTIPANCHLTVQPGVWIRIAKYVNVYVQGQLTVLGTESAPVVITSENWSEPWGGMEFTNARATLQYCFVLNGGGDLSQGNPTSDGWHTGHQHLFFGKDNSEFQFDHCFFLYSPGKVFGAQDSKVTVTNSVSSFVWHGGEFHRVLLSYRDSHLLNLPNDDHIYNEDIDTDGFHIDYMNARYPQYSVIDRCYFVTGKDDAIDHHHARLKISNCWLEDFVHEGVAASGGDTVKIFNTVAVNNDQGFENGWTESGVTFGPIVFIDHCVAVGNNVGLRVGDSYDWSYRNFMRVTNSIFYNNGDNIWNYLNSTHAPLPGAIDISYSMTNDADYDHSPFCITGAPQFTPDYYLAPGSPGVNLGTRGTNMGRADSIALNSGAVVINEIMYKAPAAMNTGDWIELHNPLSMPQDLTGWLLKDNNNGHSFRVPSGTILPANGYWVLCTDTAAFQRHHPAIKNRVGNISFGFGEIDQARLFTPAGRLVDSVAYQNTGAWPSQTDGQGYSLELLDPQRDHTAPQNWARSIQFGGTPGQSNRTTAVERRPENNLPAHFVLEQNYPNPFNPMTKIKYFMPVSGRVTVTVFDLLGRKVLNIAENQWQPA